MTDIYRPSRYSISETAPAKEPVSLGELKAHARVDFSDEDGLLSGFIESARKRVEAFTQRALITRTVTYKIDRFPPRETQVLELPRGNLQSVTSIQYLDTDGASQTWGAANYDVDTAWTPGRVALAYDKDWPDIRQWGLPVTITYDVGFGDDPGDVPEDIRNAIKLLATDLYEHRNVQVVGQSVGATMINHETLMSQYRLRRIA